jgi:hypothetical protein
MVRYEYLPLLHKLLRNSAIVPVSDSWDTDKISYLMSVGIAGIIVLKMALYKYLTNTMNREGTTYEMPPADAEPLSFETAQEWNSAFVDCEQKCQARLKELGGVAMLPTDEAEAFEVEMERIAQAAIAEESARRGYETMSLEQLRAETKANHEVRDSRHGSAAVDRMMNTTLGNLTDLDRRDYPALFTATTRNRVMEHTRNNLFQRLLREKGNT